jgi:hypothetical protein
MSLSHGDHGDLQAIFAPIPGCSIKFSCMYIPSTNYM